MGDVRGERDVCIIIPVLNEEEMIGEVVREAKTVADKVIVVDNGSTDDTVKNVMEYNVQVVNEHEEGLGNALLRGFQVALRQDFDIIVTIDGDGQHDPTSALKVIEPLGDGVGFCLGARRLTKYPCRKKFGNIFLTFVTNMLAGTDFSDTESGCRAFTAEALERIYPYLNAGGYPIAANIIFEIGRQNISYTERRIQSPCYSEGTTVLTGLKNLMFLFKHVFECIYDRLRTIFTQTEQQKQFKEVQGESKRKEQMNAHLSALFRAREIQEEQSRMQKRTP